MVSAQVVEPPLSTTRINYTNACIQTLAKWARQGSNLRPIGYEPTALPLSYGPPQRLLMSTFSW